MLTDFSPEMQDQRQQSFDKARGYVPAAATSRTAPGYQLDYVNIYRAWVDENFDDPAIRNELYNNPYIAQHLPEYFMDISGEKSTAWINNFNSQVNEYVNGVLQKYEQRSYDSPVNSVARDKAAGINDQLTGKPTEAGNGIGQPEDPNPGNTPDAVSGGDVLFGEMLPTALNVVLSFTNTVSALKTAKQGRSLQKLQMLKEGTDIFNQAIAGSGSKPSYNVSAGDLASSIGEAVGNGYMDNEDGLGQHIIDTIQGAYKSARVTQRDSDGAAIRQLNELYDDPYLKKVFSALQGRLSYDKNGNRTLGLDKERTKLIAEGLKNGQDAAKIVGSGYYDDDVEKSAGKLIDTYTNLDLHFRKTQNEILDVQKRITEIEEQISKSNRTVAANQAAASQYMPDQAAADLRQSQSEANRSEIQEGYERETQSPEVAELEAKKKKAQAHLEELGARLDALVDEEFDKLNTYANEKGDVVLKAAVIKLRSDAHGAVNEWKSAGYVSRTLDKAQTATGAVGNLVKGITPTK